MRKFLIAAAAMVAGLTGAADAQVVTGGYGVQGYPTPGPGWGGGYIDGRWSAGWRAPGGWTAYRRPYRGWQMPNYWRSRDYRIQNYAAFGLQAPPRGYGWSRYYDDAVLVDDNGYVYDSVGGLDWRRVDQPYSSGYGYPSQGYWNSPNGDYGYGGASAAAGGGGGGGYAGGGGGQAYAGDGYAYAQGGQGGQQSYGYDEQYRGGGYPGGYVPGASATATFEYDRRQPETTTTTTTTTEEWVSEPVVTYAPVQERVIYKQGPTRYVQGPTKYVQGPTRVVYKEAPPKVVYRTVVKKVPVYQAPKKVWKPKPRPAPRCADECECGVVCGS